MTKDTKNFELDDDDKISFPMYNEEVVTTIQTGPRDASAPFITPEEEAAVKAFYANNPALHQIDLSNPTTVFEEGSQSFDHVSPWIQTYSGRRFCPTNPNPDAIVIQDIAHSLSMQCRFSGHCRKFYSVAQHCVLVSYLCDSADAFWGLLHDASEAYLVDLPRPLKHSGEFNAYKVFEARMQAAICKRFGLPEVEPISVKNADKLLLYTEARDLMGPLHADWQNEVDPLPFKIDPLSQQDAKNLFMKRFYELMGCGIEMYEHYLSKQS